MRIEIAIDDKQARTLLNSNHENLRKLAEDYFKEEEYSKENEENGFGENHEFVYSVHIEKIEVSEDEFKVLKNLGMT